MDLHVLIGPGVSLLIAALGGYGTYLVFRTSTTKDLASVTEKIADTNKRVSDLAAGTITAANELRDFKMHVERHFVEKDEISELRQSFDRSIDRMQQSLDAAVGTMGDVRDAVLVMTANGSKPSVPAQRRPARPPKSGD